MQGKVGMQQDLFPTEGSGAQTPNPPDQQDPWTRSLVSAHCVRDCHSEIPEAVTSVESPDRLVSSSEVKRAPNVDFARRYPVMFPTRLVHLN
jgi:hypothetical protein